MVGCLWASTTFLLISLLSVVRSEVFTALATLTDALQREQVLAQGLRQYVELEQARLQKVLELADEYDAHAGVALVDAESHIANPVNAYLFVKKFTTDIPKTKELVSSDQNGKVFTELLEEHQSYLPDDEDLEGVVAAILRLQDTYELTSQQIADGTFTPKNKSPPLTASDCYHIGVHAHERQDYYHALTWMEEAHQRRLHDSNSSLAVANILDYLAFACYNFAYGKEDWYHMLSWMSQSQHVWEREENKTVDKASILDHLSYATTMQGNLRHAKYLTQQWLRLEPMHERAISNMIYFNKQIQKENAEMEAIGEPVIKDGVLPPLKNKRVTDSYRSGQEFINYEALCRGEDVLPNPYLHKLKCYYSTSGAHPLLLLAPVKVEEFYLDPYIVLYHDVISDTEIAIVKEISIPKLARATVNDPATGMLVTAHYRVSRSAWLRDEMNETVKVLSNRISAITHLNMEKAEDLQIQNYGIGGQYEPHCDHARRQREKDTFSEEEGNRIATWMYYPSVDVRQFEEHRGNRIATLLLYFSEVDAGGLTVFTQIGAKLPPVKGAAAFWYNLKPDGEGDDNTRHAGCPVLSGSKWVANKWFHERGQEFMRPCGLTPN